MPQLILGLAVSILSANITSARANPVLYQFTPGSYEEFFDGVIENIAGSFLYDAATSTLSNPNIVLTGAGATTGTILGGVSDTQAAGTYDIAVSAGAYCCGTLQSLEFNASATNNVNSWDDQTLQLVLYQDGNGNLGLLGNDVGGFGFHGFATASGGVEADIPEPDSLSLLGLGLVLMTQWKRLKGVTGRRRNLAPTI
jgi:hypothetical protein